MSACFLGDVSVENSSVLALWLTHMLFGTNEGENAPTVLRLRAKRRGMMLFIFLPNFSNDMDQFCFLSALAVFQSL